MPYRRTENVVRRLAAREQAILTAALSLAAEGGMHAVQIAAVAKRANIAAGTVYRYFPSKSDLIAEVIAALRLEAPRLGVDGGPSPVA
jgi:AcrR family transcriptional regulator